MTKVFTFGFLPAPQNSYNPSGRAQTKTHQKVLRFSVRFIIRREK